MPDANVVKIAPAFNVTVPRAKKDSQKTIAETYYDMYAVADSLAVEDVKIQSRQMVQEHLEGKIGGGPPRDLSAVEMYKKRTERTAFHLKNMIAMFNKVYEQPRKDKTEEK
jgi:hypothetical protein